MADERYTWYVHTNEGDNTSVGPVYIADRDYRPLVVRVHAKRAPDAGNLTVDIKDDGVSIFDTAPFLRKGATSEELIEDFRPDASSIARYSVVTLDLTPNGAAGITVHLEMEAEQDDEIQESDT